MQLDFLKEMTPVFYNQHGVKAFSRAHSFTTHWHDRIELIYLVNGELHLQTETTKRTAVAGDLIIIPPRILHGADLATPDTEYRVLMFELATFSSNITGVKNFIDALNQQHVRLTHITNDADIIAAFERIYKKQSAKGEAASLAVCADIYTLLSLLRERCVVDMLPQFPTKTAFKEVIAYIQDNYQKPLCSSQLCKKFGYSQNYFSRRFIAETGMTPTSFIRTVRLESAAQMLQETDMPINKISMTCGFASAKYFSQCFHELYGITPGQFREGNSK